MSSPMVETVRTIPLIIEREEYVPMEVENTGFPFDRDSEREFGNESFRTQLDDIAKRHPEFAEHLGGFPFRSRTGSAQNSSHHSSRVDDPEFRRFTERPFGTTSRFDRFGFPFDREELFDNEQTTTPTTTTTTTTTTTPPQSHTNYQHQPVYEHHQQQPTNYQEPPKSDVQQQEQQQQNKEDTSTRYREGGRPNIQQSNTVDLGQRQEPEVNERNQRSMSAPPDNRKRFVSSINIPINRGGMENMGQSQNHHHHQQPSSQQQQQKPTERVIPIHVEGRDEPVIPKNSTFTTSQSQPQAERIFGGQSFPQQQQQQHNPQPERIFGHRPSQFSQFVNREPSRSPQQDDLPKQQPKFQQQQQQQKPPQQPAPQQQEEQVPPQEPSKPASNNSIDIIKSIQKDVSELMGHVEQFNGKPRDKQYLYLDEMLTRNLIKLDNIDTQGQENIRQARKEAIKCIESCIGILEAKAAANNSSKSIGGDPVQLVTNDGTKQSSSVDDKMEVITKIGKNQSQSAMEVDGKIVDQVPSNKIDNDGVVIKTAISEEQKIESEPIKDGSSDSNVEQQQTVSVDDKTEDSSKIDELQKVEEIEEKVDDQNNLETSEAAMVDAKREMNDENKTDESNNVIDEKGDASNVDTSPKKKGKKKIMKK